MNPDMFWNATLLDVFLMIEGYRIRERESMRRERFSAFSNYRIFTGDTNMKPEEFLRLDDEVQEESNEEELRALYEKGINAFKN